MRIQPLTPLSAMIYADTDSTVIIPTGPPQGQPIAVGYQFIVVDNLGTAASKNIAISGPISGGTSGTSITTNYGNAYFEWSGTTFLQK